MTAKKFYATKDTDGNGFIDVGAEIYEFRSYADAVAYLIGDTDPEEFALVPMKGKFSDCWMKVPNTGPWEHMRGGIAPFRFDQLDLLSRNHIPADDRYWITPNVPVYVAIITPVED